MTEGDQSPSGGLGDLFSQFREAQAGLEAQSQAIEATVVEGSAAGGAVVVRLSGSLEAESVHIDPAIIDPADPTLLEDAVLAALRDALGRVVDLTSSLQTGIGSPFPGDMDLGSFVGGIDLGGLLGGVDVNSLMSSFGVDLAALSSSDDDEDDDEDLADDEPEA